MAGFWELPEAAHVPTAKTGMRLGGFRHTITHHHYSVTVFEAKVDQAPPGFEWVVEQAMAGLPLSTLARKALEMDGDRDQS